MFTKNFHISVLNLFITDSEYSNVINFIDKGFFGDDNESYKIFESIKKIYKEYGLINEKIFKEEYPKYKYILDIDDSDSIEYIKTNLNKFVFLTKLKEYAENISNEFKKDFRDIDDEFLRKGIDEVKSSIITDDEKNELFYYDNVYSRIINVDSFLGVPTGFYGIDKKLLGGGLCPGELGVIVASPNRGKSATLVNLAVVAAAFSRKVLYVTLEMSKEMIAHRMDMRLSGMTTDEVVNNINFVSKRIKEFQNVTKSNILIKGFQDRDLTCKDLRKYILNKKNKNQEFDFIVVDYADEMVSDYGDKGRDDLNLKDIYKGLRQIANEFDCPLWTASQTRRIDKDNDKPIDIGDLSRAYAKAFVCDVMITINQTKKQFEDGEAYYYIAKNRNKNAMFGVDLKVDWSRMIISDISDYDVFYKKD